MSHRFSLFFLLGTLLLALPARAAAPLRVVATLPDLAALAREVGGDQVRVVGMALPSQDPHFVDARPSLVLDLARADLLLLAGLDLEIGWLPVLVTGSRNARIQKGAAGYLDCSTFVQVLEVPSGPIDRSMGDIHPGGNPHYLLDPRQGLAVARGISARLAALDPDNGELYAAHLARFEQHLQADMARWEQDAAPLRDLSVIAYHRSLVYLADWLGLRVMGELEPKPGIPPTPAHLAQVLLQARAQGVRLLIQERYYPSTTAQGVAQKAGIPLVVIPGGTDFAAGQGYRQHMDELVQGLLAGLGEQP